MRIWNAENHEVTCKSEFKSRQPQALWCDGYQKFCIDAKALISGDDGKILLLRNASSKSASKRPSGDLPRGRIGSDSVKQTILEDARGGLGLAITVRKIAFAAIPDFRINGGRDWLISLVYKCSVRQNARFTLSREHDNYESVTVKDSRKLLTFMLPAESLRELFTLTAAFRRAQCVAN